MSIHTDSVFHLKLMYEQTTSGASENGGDDDLFMREFKAWRHVQASDECVRRLMNDDDGDVKWRRVELQAQMRDELNARRLRASGLRPVDEWQCHELVDLPTPGLVRIRGAFANGHQRFYVHKCLTQYHLAPNKTNLDAHARADATDLWQTVVK